MSTKPVHSPSHVYDVHIHLIGEMKTPIIVIDGFLSDDADVLRSIALTVPFSKDPLDYYPGIRSALPIQYVTKLLDCLNPLIRNVYKIPDSFQTKPKQGCFSLVSQYGKDLIPLQRLPHFDDSNPLFFAVLHYLGKGKHGATGFFRHKATNLERIFPNEEKFYFEQANRHPSSGLATINSYLVSSNDQYELYHSVDYFTNRLVIYPSNLLHSILVDEAVDVDSNPQTGRLTANLFLRYVESTQ